MTLGFEVFVQLVMAAISTEPWANVAEALPAVVSLSNCGSAPACGLNCPDCVRGACAGDPCGANVCDPFTGACVDLCANVQCADIERCDPANGLCVPRVGFCDTCAADADCVFAGTNRCGTNPLNPNERFCTRSCENQACPNGYVCAADTNGNDVCMPQLGTCTDACEGVVCDNFFDGQYCEPVAGQCAFNPVCHFNADCQNAYCRIDETRCVGYGAGASPIGGRCAMTSECGAGLGCRLETGTCVQPCDAAANCPVNQHCAIAANGQMRYCAPN